MTRYLFVGLMCSVFITCSVHAEDPSRQIIYGWNPAMQPCELVQGDASWCGPRIVYFFSCLYRGEASLQDVTRLCKADKQGLTLMYDLVSATKELGMDPMPIACDARELCSLGGPAIVAVRSRRDGPSQHATIDVLHQPVHFIGLISCESERCLIVDPAVASRPYWFPMEQFQQRFTGSAVLLKGCPMPPTMKLSDRLIMIALFFGNIVAFILLLRSLNRYLTSTPVSRSAP